ncbi:EF-Tu/IF-2/RF-3 family GTPase [Actinophytocola sp.]|jgi:elongation factor Tu|uniref:EF-Tu/IF-2/RF-3 family GTPase n=1 Tax=Actinophytocola sp. TaxID=1872138 RepID=UPI002EDB5127
MGLFSRRKDTPVDYPAPRPGPPPADGFELTVEDVFVITGRGTVVTGRVTYGQIGVGGELALTRGNEPVATTTVAGIEQFRKKTDVARLGENVGLVLEGLAREDVRRGDVLKA